MGTNTTMKCLILDSADAELLVKWDGSTHAVSRYGCDLRDEGLILWSQHVWEMLRNAAWTKPWRQKHIKMGFSWRFTQMCLLWPTHGCLHSCGRQRGLVRGLSGSSHRRHLHSLSEIAPQSPITALTTFTESQNHRIVGVGRDLCGSSSPTPLPKQGHLQ